MKIIINDGRITLHIGRYVGVFMNGRILYERVGFKQLGTIPNGFRLKNGEYEDICPYYIEV